MKTINPVLLSLFCFVPTLACDDEGIEPPLHEERDASIDEAEEASPAPSARASDEHARAQPHAEHLSLDARGPVMPEAKLAFEELSTLVESKYVDGPLSEDELWTGAMEGVLARLVQLPGHQINTLLPPRKHEELLIGTQGSLVGVGIMIERVADVVVVRGVIPDGPAEEAGLQAGDRILGIDGRRTRELDLATVVDAIRGEEGSTVELFVQRDTEEWTQKVTRGLVQVASVESTLLPDGVGYVRITSFSKNTATELDQQLERLGQQGASRVVLDLRHCPGGLLESSLEVIERFVPPGRTMMTIQPREGEPDVKTSEGEYPWQTRPLAVLIGSKTASGAELLADAIRSHDRGRLLGETTMGKHTIESIHELSGGWAVKLSVSRFASASGHSEQGVGVRPDFRIPMDGELAPVRELTTQDDPVLAAAVELLRTQ